MDHEVTGFFVSDSSAGSDAAASPRRRALDGWLEPWVQGAALGPGWDTQIAARVAVRRETAVDGE